ncbi:MAG: SEL1-like repeat protein [Pseudomonadota bacterium]
MKKSISQVFKFVILPVTVSLLAVFLIKGPESFGFRHTADENIASRAEAGDPAAQYQLARNYARGYGVEKDYESAFQWYQKAAEQGHAKSQYALGGAYDFGRGTAADAKKAEHWYRKAAEQDHITAQSNLGILLHEVGKTQQAVTWLNKAAEAGDVTAQTYLAMLYIDGDGVEQDFEKTIAWYKRAADKGYVDAQYNLGLFYMKDEGGKNWEEAFYWHKKASDQGLPQAHYYLAVMYSDGTAGEVNVPLAGKLYKKSAAGNVEQAQSYLKKSERKCFDNVAHERARAQACLILAGAGNVKAQRELVTHYVKGEGVPKDTIEAFAWGYTFLTATPPSELKKSDPKAVVFATGLMLGKMSPEDQERAKEKAKEYITEYGVARDL